MRTHGADTFTHTCGHAGAPAWHATCRSSGTAASREIAMAARSIASLTLSFGLVSIPVKLYSATEASAAIGFNLLAPDGSRVKQQYVSARDGPAVERKEMIRGYEFEQERYI